MTNIPKSILQLLIELSKYYSQKALGEGASSIVVDGITELVGEDVTEQINNFLSKEKNAKQLLKAFREADDCFIKSSDDSLIRQAIISKPFSAIQRLENIAIQLPSTLDDASLFVALRDQFKKDWPKKLSEQQLDIAATQYRICLDRALATKLEQLLPTIFRKVERIEKDVRQIRNFQSDFQQQFQKFEDLTFRQSELLLQQITGISNQVAI